MKNIFTILASLFISLQTIVHSEVYHESNLKETVHLKLPDGSEDKWKEISRDVNKHAGIVESIPLSQTSKNWTDLICIQYMNTSNLKKTAPESIDSMINLIRNAAVKSYPKNIISWKIIEKNKCDVIYESILHQSYNGFSAQHEIGRAFLTSSGFHRVGFTKKTSEMTPSEREKWIEILKKHASIVPFQDAEKHRGLSLKDRIISSIDIECPGWQIANNFSMANGYANVTYIPPSQVGTSYITECMEVATISNCGELPLSKFLEIQKKSIYEDHANEIFFEVLNQTPNEITYFYSKPKDHLQLNSVARTFLTDHGYYLISYRVGLKGRMEKQDILKWEKKLKSINVKKFYTPE